MGAEPAAASAGTVTAPDDTRIHYLRWDPPAPVADVLIVHGIGEHGGRYAGVAEALNAAGFTVVAPDLRGHGLSEGRRGHVDSFGDFLADLDTVRSRVLGSDHAGSPWFLLGHSLGGLLVTRYLQSDWPQPRAAVLSAPVFDAPVPAWAPPIARVASAFMGFLPFRSGIDPADLSRDSAAVEAYRRDPLIHGRITPRLFIELRSAMSAAPDEVDRIHCPVLFLIPLDDRVVDSHAALRVARSLGDRAEVREFPGAFHEIFHGPDRAAAYARMVAFLHARMAA